MDETQARAKGGEAELPGKRSAETLSTADKLVEAIELVEIELSKGPETAPDPMLVAYNITNPVDYLLKVLIRISSSELEETLLVLPFSYVRLLFPFSSFYIGNPPAGCLGHLHVRHLRRRSCSVQFGSDFICFGCAQQHHNNTKTHTGTCASSSHT